MFRRVGLASAPIHRTRLPNRRGFPIYAALTDAPSLPQTGVTSVGETPAPYRPPVLVFTLRQLRRTTMPRKPGLNSEFVMFDVFYEDGTQRSNRKVPRTLTGGLDGDKPAHGFLIEQDRDIAEKSGKPPPKIKSIVRSGATKKAHRRYEYAR
jgi:hypothetical protein